ncbi:methyltransferase domain protein [Bacteriovorax sp. Seq25_V]|nr:methyltransferase domain protein [Bacteriovorax sp. Seq25_V]
MIQQDESTLLSFEQEKERYSHHNNDSEDPGYIKFLKQLTDPLLDYIDKDARGLDFGCGPGPTISKILAEENISCDNYDPAFFPDKELLATTYDFVTSSEVFEHLHQPREVIENVWSLVRPGGLLAIMTVFYPGNQDEFPKWWYKNDPTHVCFYNEQVFEYIANKLNAEILSMNKKIVILRRAL